MFSARLKHPRDTYKPSPRELSDETKLPLSQINSIESGKSIPNLTALIRLSDYLDVSIDFLAGRNDRIENDPEKYISISISNLSMANVDYLYMYADLSRRTNTAEKCCECGCKMY